MNPWKVQIIGGSGGIVEDVVFAKSAKGAFQATIANLPENHPAWQWPGWRVCVSLMNEAFIVGAIIKGSHDT